MLGLGFGVSGLRVLGLRVTGFRINPKPETLNPNPGFEGFLGVCWSQGPRPCVLGAALADALGKISGLTVPRSRLKQTTDGELRA